MKKAHFSERGQALIIFVFALIGLIGITGLAVDGGSVLAERRHAQNAADTAAMAGALAKINGQEANSSWTNANCSTTSSACWSAIVNTAKDRASSNGYTGDLVNNTVEVHIPPISGPYSVASYSLDPRDYVQVIINTNVNTFFARVLGIAQTHNRVEAVALAKYARQSGLYGGNSLIELKPHGETCSGEFSVSGNTVVNLIGGGIFVNSDNTTCAWKYPSGCPTINLSNGANIQVVGSVDPSGGTCSSQPPISHPTEQYPYPPERLIDRPPECDHGPTTASYLDGSGTWHYYPGYYSMLPPDHNVVLEPGVYCVQDVVKTINPTTLNGNGVFLYILPGGDFNFQGGTIHLAAMGDPLHPTPYDGFLIYVAPESDYTGVKASYPAPDCIINGGSDDTMTGVIYAPYCDVTINGQSGTFGLTAQVAAYTVTLTGNATLNFTYDPNKLPQIPEVRHTGLYR